MPSNRNNTRWGLNTRSESNDARERLLNAACRCYARIGIAKTCVADIAAEAKITRRTVYRHFAGQEDILYAVVRRESERFWRDLHGALAHIDNFGDYLVEALLYIVQHAPQTSAHSYLFNPEVLAIVRHAHIGNMEWIKSLADSWEPVYRRLKKNGDAEVDLVMVCEWFNRLAISYLATPSPIHRSDEEMRGLFRHMLLPALMPKH